MAARVTAKGSKRGEVDHFDLQRAVANRCRVHFLILSGFDIQTNLRAKTLRQGAA
jgi:hypothetical protein